MNMEQRIKTAAAYKGLSQAKIAVSIGMTASNFNQKLKRGTFTEQELDSIATQLGATYICAFEFPDGTRF